MELLKRLMVDEDGQGVVEYTLMIGLVVLGIWVAVQLLDIPGAVSALWTNVSTQLTTAAS